MQSSTPVEIADQYSRKRTAIMAAAALAFLGIHGAMRPFFYASQPRTIDWWAITAAVLLGVLATGGGLLNPARIRALVNDDVSRENGRTAVGAGYWVAMAAAMGLYLVPGAERFTAREAVYVVVTASLGVALLAFSYLEHRAHRDA